MILFLSLLNESLLPFSMIDRMAFLCILKKNGHVASLGKLSENFYSIIMESWK